MPWSPFQNAIFEAVENTNNSLIIEAVAGSGKTTTIVEAIKHVPSNQSVCFLAFNKGIADELKRRVTSPNARCMTLHAAGFSAWRKQLAGESWNCKVNSNKTRGIVDELLQDKRDRFRYGGQLPKLIALAKGNGIVPISTCEDTGEPHKLTVVNYAHKDGGGVISYSCEDCGRPSEKCRIKGYVGLIDDDNQVWEDMIDFYDLDRDAISLDIARRVLAHSISIATMEIDFDDQLYMPIISGAPFDKYDVIFLDESQDVNGIQIEIVDRMRKPSSRVIAVGDPNQAIYGFRGALADSMENIKKRFRCRSLPLSVSYRCPKAVVKRAQKYVPHIQSHESAPEGLVTETVAAWPLNLFKASDAILCRNTAPLISAAFMLIRNKISCRVLGRDIGQGLIALVKKMKAANIADLVKKLRNYRIKQLQRYLARGEEDKIASLDDKLDTLYIFIEEVGIDGSIETLINDIQSLFTDIETVQVLTLATIHKSKGLEWERVFILDAQTLMPSPYARKSWQKQQEINLMYVAATRSKDTLYYVESLVLGREACDIHDAEIVDPDDPKHPKQIMNRWEEPKQIGNSPLALLEESVEEQSTTTDDSEVTSE